MAKAKNADRKAVADSPTSGVSEARRSVKAVIDGWRERPPARRFLSPARSAARMGFWLCDVAKNSEPGWLAERIAELDEHTLAARRELNLLGQTYRPTGWEDRGDEWRGFAGWPSLIAYKWANELRSKIALKLYEYDRRASNAIGEEAEALPDDALLNHAMKLVPIFQHGPTKAERERIEDLLHREQHSVVPPGDDDRKPPAPPAGDSEPTGPALTNNQSLVLRTMARFDGSLLLSAAKIAAEMNPATRLSEETVRQCVGKLIESNLAERPEGERSGARLTNAGRKLAVKIAD
jgi:hypothetical protein